MKIKTNVIAQLLSWVFIAFTFSGWAVDNPEMIANRIVEDLSNGQFVGLALFLLTNVGVITYHWIQTIRVNGWKYFFAFVHSTNFWLAGFNIGAGILYASTGIQIPEEVGAEFITLLFSEQYIDATMFFLANILMPIVKSLFPKKQIELVNAGPPLSKVA